ncbi:MULTISPECIES: EthD domain-containing protein [Dietzia]|uniref:EthD domain-containing protein n=1 Tax=Dietzia TaxID=37914 RepID=UPI0019D15A5B|nr:EthD domain-containing protein [Dietzia sp. KRD202]
MDMLLAVVWADDDVPVDPADAAGLRARIADAVEGPLAALGVDEYLLNVRDEAVSGAMIDVRVTPRPVLAALRARVPVASASACADLMEALRELGPVSAWSVTASEPLPAAGPGPGGRCEGMANLAFLRRPERIGREEWLRTWLEEHTQVAIDTQSTTAYTQHVVVRALTADAPVIDGIVEEVFPIEAATDLGVFFDAGGDDSRMAANIEAMTASTGRFLDDGTVDAVPTGRYVMGVPGAGV